MKLKMPEGNVIVVFEPEDYLSAIVSELLDDDYYLFCAHDAAALKAILEKEEDRILFMLALDETQRYDTLEIIEACRNEQWFEGALSLVVAKAYQPGREEKADALGIQDYLQLSSVSTAERERVLTSCISRQLRWMKKLQRLRKSANCDGLTGFYNHAAAADILTKLLRNNPEQTFLFSIIDIDYFKQVNDARGHEFGDKVLREEAKRIRQTIGEQALAIRYGGDEFVVMVPVASDMEEIAHGLSENTHFLLEDYPITNSIGITSTISGERDWERLFRQADQAMYMAKVNGRDQYCIYTADMSCKLDGVGEEVRNEALNLSPSALIHALADNCFLACHLDLCKVAVTKLVKTASGEYGWSDPMEYIPFIKNLLELVEEKSRLRFSEFINPNTLAGRLKTASRLSYFFAGVDGKPYRAEYLAGDSAENGQIANALLLIGEADHLEHGAPQDDATSVDKCLASGLMQTYNAIWIIHPNTFSRELVSIQTDISRHRRINRLIEGGNYWEDTQRYLQMYVVNEEERKALLKALHPQVVFREVEEKGRYTLHFHRKVDGVTNRCEYCFIGGVYAGEKVILQLYRRLQKTKG